MLHGIVGLCNLKSDWIKSSIKDLFLKKSNFHCSTPVESASILCSRSRICSGRTDRQRSPALCAVSPARQDRGRRQWKACRVAGTVNPVMATSTSMMKHPASCAPTAWCPTPTGDRQEHCRHNFKTCKITQTFPKFPGISGRPGNIGKVSGIV